MSEFTSQYGIEKIVLERFPEPGYFLEIGAWDGFRLSQTAYLELEKGWTGLCIDPFLTNFLGRKCKVSRVALSGDGKNRSFVKVETDTRDKGDVSYFSGFDNRLSVHRKLIEDHCVATKIKISTIMFEDLCRLYQVPKFVQFLSIDTEGSELEILKSVNFSRRDFGIIAYEHNGNMEIKLQADKLLKDNGYKHLLEISKEDSVYVKA